jgi:hypothetical protein
MSSRGLAAAAYLICPIEVLAAFSIEGILGSAFVFALFPCTWVRLANSAVSVWKAEFVTFARSLWARFLFVSEDPVIE